MTFFKKEIRFSLALSSLSALALATLAVGGITLSAPQVQAADAVKQIKLGTKGDTLAFDQVKLTAKPKQKVKVTFKNNAGKSSGMQHNFVLVKPGTDAEVANAGIAAGAEKNWTPASPNIIAATKLANPGESQTVEFTAPEQPGDYPFICTFPGHAALMKGVLTVK
ncbi:MAG: hypothetical protein H7222_08350 [Methylotenera sp.]|nr:hypothetical protein [Oligoflexia bacterium]